MAGRLPELRFTLSPGEAGVSECLAAMAQIVVQCPALDAVGTGRLVMDTAKRLTAQGSGIPRRYCDAVYTLLAAKLRFRRDPPFTELVRHPDELLWTIAQGGHAECDCDEVATLGAALLWARGIEPMFLVAGRPRDYDSRGRVKLSHVFYAAKVGGRIVPFDPQERIPAGTWPPPAAIGRMERYDILPQKNRAA